MAKVKVSDVIVPSVFAPYAIERTAELSRLQQSGIVENNERFDEIASGEGKTFNLPFWQDLSGSSEEQSDTSAATPDKMQAQEDIAVKHFRIKAWSANDLSGIIAGSDPMKVIADLTAAFWDRDMQKKLLLPSLKGIFTTALSTTHVLNRALEAGDSAAEANLVGSDTVIDASNLLGDAWDRIIGMAMHSKPFSRLQKLDLIETEHLDEQDIDIHRFLRREVIVDDGMPVVAGTTNGFKYTTYLFGRAAVGLGNGGPEPEEFVETDRDALGSDNILVNRRHLIMHPRGVAFTGTPAGQTPTQAELELGSNWTKRWEGKNIALIKLVTNG